MALTPHTSTMLALVLIVALVISAMPASAMPGFINLKEGTFSELKGAAREQVVAFYHSSNPAHMKALSEFDAAASIMASEIPSISFYACDGDSPLNKAEFADAGFKNDYFVFTATPTIGITRFPLPATASAVVDHLRDLYATPDLSSVADIVSEDNLIDSMDSPQKPTIVKFYENWCTHCRALHAPFAIASQQLGDQARFVQVRCSHNDDTQALCKRLKVASFPTIIAFDGEGRGAKYAYPARSVSLIKRFVERFAAGEGASLSGVESHGEGVLRVTGEIGAEFVVTNDPAVVSSIKISYPSPVSLSSEEGGAAPASAGSGPGAGSVSGPSAGAGASLGTEASCAARVGTLERALEVLLARVEALEAARGRG